MQKVEGSVFDHIKYRYFDQDQESNRFGPLSISGTVKVCRHNAQNCYAHTFSNLCDIFFIFISLVNVYGFGMTVSPYKRLITRTMKDRNLRFSVTDVITSTLTYKPTILQNVSIFLYPLLVV